MFFDMVFRSLWRQKTRSALTVLGVILAIAAIVSLGSISEGISYLVEDSLEMAGDFIAVAEKGSMEFSGPPDVTSRVPREYLDEIAQIDGVEEVTYQIEATYNRLFVSGNPIEDLEFFDMDDIEFIAGGLPAEGAYEVVLGYAVAEERDLVVGDELKIKDDEYTVVGIWEKLDSFMDYGIVAPAEPVGETFGIEDYYTSIIVIPEDPADMERIDNEIEELYDDMEAITTIEAAEKAAEAIGSVRIMTLSIGVIASIVASIGIINTMIMIVMERKRDFGIMKALGAQRSTILVIVILEGMILGAVGSIIGISLGVIGVEAVNQASGFPIARVTTNLMVLSFLYGMILAAVAALYPSWQATKVNPIDAIRSQ